MDPVPRKQEILEQAARLFLEKGYNATSVRDIAAAVGIEASSLYSHIKSKESILEALCHHCADRYNSTFDIILASHRGRDLDILIKMLEFHIDTAFNDPTSGIVFSEEWKHLPDEKKKVFIVKRKEYEAKLTQLISQLMDAHTLHKGNPVVAMNTLISSVRWIHHTRKKFSEEEKRKAKDEILQLLLRGLEQ